MLSILIPVYNFDARGLVSELLAQIQQIDAAVEILLLDDGSNGSWRAHLLEISQSPKVTAYYFNSNQGRIAARRGLAKLAQYSNLLFIDCDAQLTTETYVIDYINNIGTDTVIVGGHVYQDDIPESKYRLHWKYGREIEVRSLSKRQQYPHQSFSTFNFCVPKDIFKNYLIDISVDGYGHEDTLIGHILKTNNIKIQHINSPLLHSGLKDVNQFLEDVRSASENAILLSESNPDIEIKIIKYRSKLQSMGLIEGTRRLLNKFENRIMNNLHSDTPSIWALQCYKLKIILDLDPQYS